MPEIAEARALLTTLANTQECRSAAASRERRLKLQTSYGLAVAWSKGFAAEETNAALPRGLMDAVMRQESEFSPTALSPARAVGLMQLLPETARITAGDPKIDDRALMAPAANLRIGPRYLREVPELLRLRYTSPHPRHVTPALVAAHANLDVLPAHVHLPVQSVSGRMFPLRFPRYRRQRVI